MYTDGVLREVGTEVIFHSGECTVLRGLVTCALEMRRLSLVLVWLKEMKMISHNVQYEVLG